MFAALAGILVLASCEKSAVDPLFLGSLSGIVVDPSALTMDALGDTVRFDIRPIQRPGTLTEFVAPAWQTLDPGVLSITADGLATSREPGTARVVAMAQGLTDTAVVEVRQLATSLEVLRAADTLDALGAETTLEAMGEDRNGFELRPGQMTWRSLSTSVVEVQENGRATARSTGSAQVEVSNLSGLSARTTVLSRQIPTILDLTPATYVLTAVDDTVRLQSKGTDANGFAVSSVSASWESLSPTVAEVSGDGLVKALAEGEASIVALAAGAADTARVMVDPMVWSLSIEPSEYTLVTLGEQVLLQAFGEDANGYPLDPGSLSWTSLDETVAVVDDEGVVTAVSSGATEVEAATPAGVRERASIVVRQEVAFLEIVPDSVFLDGIGRRAFLSVAATDSGGSPIPSPDIQWTSLDPTVATVDQAGTVEAEGAGATQIRAQSADGPSDTAVVVVEHDSETLRVQPHSVTLTALGDTIRLKATKLDANGDPIPGVDITWQALELMVEVDEGGLVTAQAVGTGRIVALADGLRDTATVTVTQVPYSLSISPDSVHLEGLGATGMLNAVVRDANGQLIAQPDAVSWVSLDPEVASVTSTGVVRADKAGVAHILASTNPEVADTALVTVHIDAPADSVYNVPASIDPTGGADVTIPLNAFFASVPNGSVVRFPSGARYRVEGSLYFENRHGLTIDGNSATIFAETDGSDVAPPEGFPFKWPIGRRHVAFVGGSNIILRNITIRGANPHAGTSPEAFVSSLEAQHAFAFLAVEGVELSNVIATDVYGDFVYLGGYRGVWTQDVYVHDSHFERNGRQGIAITGAEDVLLERNYFGDIRRSAIDLEPAVSSGGARRVQIRNNIFGPTRLRFLAAGGSGSNVRDITIEANELRGSTLTVIVKVKEGERRARFRIVGNTSDSQIGSPVALMRFTGVDGIEVRGNRQRLNATRDMIGVETWDSCDVVVTANEFSGAAEEVVVHEWEGCANVP